MDGMANDLANLKSMDPPRRAMLERLAVSESGLYAVELARHAALRLGLKSYQAIWAEARFLEPLAKAGWLIRRWDRWILRPERLLQVLDQTLEEGCLPGLAKSCGVETAYDFPEYALNIEKAYTQINLRVLMGQCEEVLHLHENLAASTGFDESMQRFSRLLDPAHPRLMAAMHPQIRALAAQAAWLKGVADLGQSQPRLRALLELGDPAISSVLGAGLALLDGNRAEAARVVATFVRGRGKPFSAWLALLEGRAGEALATLDEALKLERKERGRRKCGLFGFGALIHALALLKAAPARRPEAMGWLLAQASVGDPFRDHAALLAEVLRGLQEDPAHIQEMTKRLGEQASPLDLLLLGSGLAWAGLDLDPAFRARLRQLREDLPRMAWGRAELDLLLNPSEAKAPGLGWARWIQPVPAWTRALDSLEALAPDGEAAPERPRRLTWFVCAGKDDFIFKVEPRDQKRGPRGWGKGQVLGTGRSLNPTVDTWILDQDWPALDLWRQSADGYRWRGIDLEALSDQLEALAGHPLVFLERPGGTEPTPLRVETASPELLVDMTPQGRRLRLHPAPPKEGNASFHLEGELLRVIRFHESHLRVAASLSSGISIPPEGMERLEALLPRLAQKIPIRCDAPVGGGTADTVPADPMLQVVLQPMGQGLRATARYRPVLGGPWVRPGAGDAALVVAVDGRLLQTSRDLADEKARVAELLEACPALGEGEDGPFEYRLPGPAQALELLEALDLLQGRAQAHWPAGSALSLAARVDEKQFRMKAQAQGNWFEASGELKLEDGQVLTLVELLRLMEDTPGRFIALGEGRFLALSAAFRKRLGELAGLGEAQGKAWRMPALAAPLLEADLEGDAGFQAMVSRYQEAFSQRSQVPAGLQAELRPYQEEGFQWLTRMAAWGAGAVLADDMGLGKTIMSLALLLHRAKKGGGPALVVAPTSVMANWETEGARFAPELTFHRYHDADRERLLKKLGRKDVVITSYGLLQQDADAFASRQWHTLVFDEAQSLKNAQTKRSQAASGLKAEFTLALSGTPLENNLGELWSLFRILNPGLLGSQERFNRRFAGPIERDRDSDTLHRLQRLVRPFLLRRTKAQVLEDLPERTEILREVELSPEEATLYEALRRKALEDMETAAAAPPGQRAVKILAELMKLRRACCHPSLAAPEWTGPAAKLEAFQELAEELREGGHRTLVFSQFVDSLHIVRDWMDAQGIPFQYLDGSSPAKARAKAVTAFQEGDGDFFLISLTAGGLGLNLTAADYVIILDPWWNPAVEDQASSRAHRMGQQRPVTVYRLVAKGTLEAKIVQLHHRKRELAESILASGDGGGRLNAEDLLDLLKDR